MATNVLKRKPLEGYVEVDFQAPLWDLTVYVSVEQAGDNDDSAFQAASAIMEEVGFDPTDGDPESERRVRR